MFYNEGGEALAQVAQRSCGCPLPGNIQGQVEWGFAQCDLVKDVPARCRGVGLDAHQRSHPTQNILWFYDSKTLSFL